MIASRRGFRLAPLAPALWAALAFAPCSHAAGLGWYLSGAVGRATAGVNAAELGSHLNAAGISATAQVNGTDAGWTLVGGLQLQRHWAVEGGYVDLGRARTQVNAVGISDSATLLRAIVDDSPVLPHGWIVQAVGRIFPTRRLRAFVRIGLLRWESDVGAAAPPLGALHRHLTGVDFTYGAGLEYRLLDHVSLRFALQRYQLRDGPVDFTSLGLRYDFHGAVR
jgi:OOP family OmpA-OmpF porin